MTRAGAHPSTPSASVALAPAGGRGSLARAAHYPEKCAARASRPVSQGSPHLPSGDEVCQSLPNSAKSLKHCVKTLRKSWPILAVLAPILEVHTSIHFA